MASSVSGILGTPADGETFSGQSHRLGMASHATIVNDGAGPLTSRSGIIPGGGNPLTVAALSTPVMKVRVQPGTCVIQSTDGDGGVFSVTLDSVTDLDIGTANATYPRTDVVVAEVYADGSASTNCSIKVIAGVAGSLAPRNPSLTSPPGNTHYFPLAQVRVEAAATTITAGKITKTAVDGVFTAAPGGLVPVASTAAAASLPNFSPFINADGLHWTKLGGVAYQDGLQHRYINGIVSSDSSGDFNAGLGSYVNGVITTSPFPNACLGATLQHVLTTDPRCVTFSLISTGVSTTRWRASAWNGVNAVDMFRSQTFVVTGIAWGY